MSGQVVSRPALFERLGGLARVTVISAPAGSGKTVLLRSWMSEAGLEDRAAWVPVGPNERDPQRFWLSVLQALRRTSPGSGLIQAASAAPNLDGWAPAERLLHDLAALEERTWLVIDDVHELGSTEALRQLELLVMRAPPTLRFVFATRHDVRLGLHRLRLEGGLAEIRTVDLRFSLAEAHELLERAGVALPEAALATLHRRTEGWAAGLRLAALSLAGHPDPARFAAEFSGGERTVAEYLLAEVLERQSEQVRRLLLRTSLLERVNGELADLLAGDEGAEAILQDLEQANAFVVSLDPARTWFRYHQMFADLLQVELRRSAPGEVARLHLSAAGWFAGNGFLVEAIRHAQAARDWPLAARLLADHWPSMHLDGQAATVHELLARFPPDLALSDAELAVVAAADGLAQGSQAAAERDMALAERGSTSVPQGRRGQLELLLGIARLLHARQVGNLAAVAEEARKLQDIADVPDPTRAGLSEDLRALALINLGTAEFWAGQLVEAERHLERGMSLARQIGRPYLEFTGLAYQAGVDQLRSVTAAMERGRQAVELAQRHGWNEDPAVGFASLAVGSVLVWKGRFEEAQPWIQRAERALGADAEPALGLTVRWARGLLELARGRDTDALAAFQAADRLAGRLARPNHMVLTNRSHLVQTLVRLGETERAEQALAELDDQDRNNGTIRTSLATLRLAQHNPQEATAALAPVLDGSAPLLSRGRFAQALLLESIAQDALGDEAAAALALERALDLAEPDGVLLRFLLYPAPDLLERHARQGTAHAALVADILSLLAGRRLAPPPGGPQPLLEPLSDSELRVLRYLPTNLTAPEIARELYVSPTTVKTHIRNVYAKLGTHRRAAAVESARALGLLAPSGATRTQVAEPAPR